MKIDDALITYLENLSRLTLSDTEREQAKSDLGDIIRYMDKLGEVDAGDAPALSHPFEEINRFREDVVLPGTPRAVILSGAPDKTEAHFRAPKTVEG